VVSLPDKHDSAIAGFWAGLELAGSSDPFGLRRAGKWDVKLAMEALPGLDLPVRKNCWYEDVFTSLADRAEIAVEPQGTRTAAGP
jgi:glycyl-tRNA synthetase beta subunit